MLQSLGLSIFSCLVEMYPAVSAQSTICINLFYNKKETKIFNFIREREERWYHHKSSVISKDGNEKRYIRKHNGAEDEKESKQEKTKQFHKDKDTNHSFAII